MLTEKSPLMQTGLTKGRVSEAGRFQHFSVMVDLSLDLSVDTPWPCLLANASGVEGMPAGAGGPRSSKTVMLLALGAVVSRAEMMTPITNLGLQPWTILSGLNALTTRSGPTKAPGKEEPVCCVDSEREQQLILSSKFKVLAPTAVAVQPQ